ETVDARAGVTLWCFPDHRSLPLPLRRALVEEGVHAFAEILAHVAHEDEVLALRRRELGAEAPERLLGRLQGQGRVARDELCRLLGTCHEPGVAGTGRNEGGAGSKNVWVYAGIGDIAVTRTFIVWVAKLNTRWPRSNAAFSSDVSQISAGSSQPDEPHTAAVCKYP